MSKNTELIHETEENSFPQERSRREPMSARHSATTATITTKKRLNGDDKVIKFRCDFPSTQVRVMLARGWIQVMGCPLFTLRRVGTDHGRVYHLDLSSLKRNRFKKRREGNSWLYENSYCSTEQRRHVTLEFRLSNVKLVLYENEFNPLILCLGFLQRN